MNNKKVLENKYYKYYINIFIRRPTNAVRLLYTCKF